LIVLYTKNGKSRKIPKIHDSPITSIAYKGNTNILYSLGEDGKVKTLVESKSEEVLSMNRDLKGKWTLLESPKLMTILNQFVLISRGHLIQAYHTETKKLTATFEGHSNSISSISLSSSDKDVFATYAETE